MHRERSRSPPRSRRTPEQDHGSRYHETIASPLRRGRQTSPLRRGRQTSPLRGRQTSTTTTTTTGTYPSSTTTTAENLVSSLIHGDGSFDLSVADAILFAVEQADLPPAAVPAPVRLADLPADVQCLVEASWTLVGFGKHSDKTYGEALVAAPDYCRWVLKQASNPAAAAADSSSPDSSEEQHRRPKEELVSLASWLESVRCSSSPRLALSAILSSSPESSRLDVSAVRLQAENLVDTSELFLPAREMPFGKHKGTTLREMTDRHPGYCRWMIRRHESSASASHPVAAFSSNRHAERDSVMCAWMRNRLRLKSAELKSAEIVAP